MEQKTIYEREQESIKCMMQLMKKIKKLEEENKMLSNRVYQDDAKENQYEYLMKKMAKLEIKLNEINFDYSTINEHEERISSLENKPKFDESKEPKEIKKEDLTFAEALQLLQSGKPIGMAHSLLDGDYVYINSLQYLVLKTSTGSSFWIPNNHEILNAKWRVIE